MKKTCFLLLIVASIFQSFVAKAQWTTSGTNIYNSNTGFVGVGTTTPASLFHLSANMTPGAITELLRLEIRGNSGDELGGEGAAINFFTPITPNPNVLGAQIYSFRESNVNTTSTTTLRFATNNAGTMSDKLVILGNGNVGIGTTVPGNLFTVSGSGTVLNVTGNGQFNNGITVVGGINRTGSFGGSLATTAGAGLTMGASTYTDAGSASGATVAGNAYIGFGTPTFAATNTSVTYTNGYNLYVSGAPLAGTNATITHPYAVYVNSGLSYFGGNLLVGKTTQTNSSYLLDVGGNVRANEIVVNTTGADFVFAPSYHLHTLSGLKQYIAQNHHLPDIASAKEMQIAGLNVGENETKLLQKVEEVTLYLIDKDKEIKKEQEKNKEQEAQLKMQEKRLDKLEKALAQLTKSQK